MTLQTLICLAHRLHLTNAAVAGTTQFLLSFLPALERNAGGQFGALPLSDQGVLASWKMYYI